MFAQISSSPPHPRPRPGSICTDTAQELIDACQDLQWNHDTGTPHRSETNGVAEGAVRRVKKGRAVALVHSGPPEELVRLCAGMVVFPAQCPEQDGPTARQHSKSVLVKNLNDHKSFLEHWLSTCRLPRKTSQASSTSEENAEGNILGRCATCEGRIIRRLTGCRL